MGIPLSMAVRDLAMINLLASSGMRVGEMVALNREDINFSERECVVLGKGNKERKVYLTEVAAMHLQEYINSRQDPCESLFAGRGRRLGKTTS